MAINQQDLVGAFLDEQARINAAIDDGNVNNVVEDLQILSGDEAGPGVETLTTFTSHPPHYWDDSTPVNTVWGFFAWA
jgi:hypothetical protein